MKAICREAYGLPEVLELREIDKPAPADDEVLVRVRAASVNPVDWHALTGTPYLVRTQEGLRRPKGQRVGTDFAGTIEATGKAVERFQPGADVFGVRDGALGEYVCIREDRALAVKPANVSFEQAAAVPVAGVTALQGLRDKGGLKPGQKVVVNGASGGVGTFAVQIAKALGAEVTAVCSTRNLDQARALGADRVIDYTREDFTRSAGPCDVLLDIAGNRSWRDSPARARTGRHARRRRRAQAEPSGRSARQAALAEAALGARRPAGGDDAGKGDPGGAGVPGRAARGRQR